MAVSNRYCIKVKPAKILGYLFVIVKRDTGLSNILSIRIVTWVVYSLSFIFYFLPILVLQFWQDQAIKHKLRVLACIPHRRIYLLLFGPLPILNSLLFILWLGIYAPKAGVSICLISNSLHNSFPLYSFHGGIYAPPILFIFEQKVFFTNILLLIVFPRKNIISGSIF